MAVPLPRISCIIPALALSACHWIFQYSGGATDGPRADLAADLKVDLPPGTDGPLADQRWNPDAQPTQLVCAAPTPVGTNPPPSLHEAALRVDGLELVASGSTVYHTTRLTTDMPLGDWEPLTEFLPDGAQDPTFFLDGNEEKAIIAVRPGSNVPRGLQLCSGSLPCTPIRVFHRTGGDPITYDMDGPTVTTLPTGQLLMAFNVQTDVADEMTADIYLATPKTSDLTQWEAWRLPTVNQDGYKEDDPALSPNGTILIFEGKKPAGQDGLWVSFRPALDLEFSTPQKIVMAGMGDPIGQPCLAQVSPDKLELFFDIGTSGQIYRATCRPQ